MDFHQNPGLQTPSEALEYSYDDYLSFIMIANRSGVLAPRTESSTALEIRLRSPDFAKLVTF